MSSEKTAGLVANSWTERGIAVFFTTPALTQARMRCNDGPGRCEFVLPSLSGGKGYYIMPWKSIMSTITTTLHDRVLFEQIQKRNVDDPIKMRYVTLDVAAQGLAGPRAAQKAREILDGEKQYQIMTSFLLILQLLKLINISPNNLIEQGLGSISAQRELKAALKGVAQRLNVSQDELYMRIETLSSLVAPIGLPQASEPGRLRALSDELSQFSHHLRQWSLEMPDEIAHLGVFEASIADLTNKMSEKVVKVVHNETESLSELLKTWEKNFSALREQVQQLAWLLDGWDYLIGEFRDAAAKGSREREAMVANSFALLPIIPRNQLEIISDQQAHKLTTVHRRWVRANEDWRTGLLDYEQVQRNEVRKAELR